jgi:hypothetical protein
MYIAHVFEYIFKFMYILYVNIRMGGLDSSLAEAEVRYAYVCMNVYMCTYVCIYIYIYIYVKVTKR